MTTELKVSKRQALLRLLGAGAGALAPGLGQTADAQGMELAQAVLDRPAGRDLTSVITMELGEPGAAPRVRRLVSYRLTQPRGASATLIRFLEPRDVAGTGLLSLNSASGRTDQSLYLPALGKVRRIASDRKGGRFVGSDIYFEDLQERPAAHDRHAVTGTDTVAGVTCQLLVSVPVDPDNSVYRRRISWVDPKTLVVLRVDYHEDNDQKPSKRFEVLAREQVQSFWTVTDSRVTDLTSGHQTRMKAERVVYDRKLPNRLFTPQALADEGLESEYRP
ncbi:MAG: outer membrane lipoprotein-sorting protein [Rhodoferax sp.]|nr:outer membrane lipoprotein-sorting protein [Rhodoferax sp.]